jgi:predicted phosphoadenosine phosphosulfate sulfurtransferase
LFFLDEEAVYQSTADQIEWLMNLYPENTNKVWLQIEFNLTNATSMKEPYLKCWEAGKHKEWMRPKKQYSIHFKPWDSKKETIRNKDIGLDFYSVLDNFEGMYTNTAFLVGLRATESPNRWRAMVKNPVKVGTKNIYYATNKGNGNASFYPLYDWNFHDIWKFIYDEKIRYSKIYDYLYKKGFGISEIRISSLVHERSFKSLCELPEFEPKTFERLCARVKGITFAQETGRNRKMFKAQQLPKNFKTWSSYRNFLLETYPYTDKKEIFVKRFAKHLQNEFVARQQVRQLVLNDYENNLPVNSKPGKQ